MFYPQICSNLNQCFCDNGWTGNDCSIQLEISPTSQNSADVTLSPEDAKKAKNDLESKMIMKETPYGMIKVFYTIFLIKYYSIYITYAYCSRTMCYNYIPKQIIYTNKIV
jgi:hypothetical protein